MLNPEFQCGFYACSTSPFGLTTSQVVNTTCGQWAVDSSALSCTTALRATAFPVVPGSCELPLWKNTTKHWAALKPRCADLAVAVVTSSIHSPHGACPGVSQVPSRAVTLCCVCLSRAMVCSQRNASLSQSPRVGFLSSLLPQSKKSPSRLSPAQGPSQTQSSAKKESFGSQVGAGPAFLTLARRPPTPYASPTWRLAHPPFGPAGGRADGDRRKCALKGPFPFLIISSNSRVLMAKIWLFKREFKRFWTLKIFGDRK